MNILEEESLEFFSSLLKHNVKFMLVGGIAVNYYGHSRTTGDIDIWIEDSLSNRTQLVKALSDYGIPGAEIFLTTPLIAGFSEILLENGVYVDLMCDLQFFKKDLFQESFDQAEIFLLGGKEPIKVIHIQRLIEEKKKSSRPKDQDDALQLEKILNKCNK